MQQKQPDNRPVGLPGASFVRSFNMTDLWGFLCNPGAEFCCGSNADPGSGGSQAPAGPTNSGSVLRTTVKSADEVRYDRRAGGGSNMCSDLERNMF